MRLICSIKIRATNPYVCFYAGPEPQLTEPSLSSHHAALMRSDVVFFNYHTKSYFYASKPVTNCHKLNM